MGLIHIELFATLDLVGQAPGGPDEGIMRGDGPLIAWFTDPAGNILSVLQQ